MMIPQECEAFWTELLPCLFEDDDLKEPDRRLQVYGVVVATVNKGRLCPDELFEFKEMCVQEGVRPVVGHTRSRIISRRQKWRTWRGC